MAYGKIALLVLTYAAILHTNVFAFSETREEPSSDLEGPKNNFYLEIESKCKDTYGKCTEEYCFTYNTKSWKRKMRKRCKRTCGYCRAHSPPACFRSRYGCCWDYVTSALGPGGKGCPPCGDNNRYPNVCVRFRTYCRRRGISGKWMRGNCPDACGHCSIWQFK